MLADDPSSKRPTTAAAPAGIIGHRFDYFVIKYNKRAQQPKDYDDVLGFTATATTTIIDFVMEKMVSTSGAAAVGSVADFIVTLNQMKLSEEKELVDGGPYQNVDFAIAIAD